MWWCSKKYLFLIVTLLVLSGCSAITIGELGVLSAERVGAVSVIDTAGRSGQIYSRALRRLIDAQGNSTPEYDISTIITISSSSALSVRGATTTLKKMKMVASFTLTQRIDSKVVLNESVTTDSTLGTVSSLFSQDQSESHARDRMSELLAHRVMQRLQLYFSEQSEQ